MSEPEYILGHDEGEFDRLDLQAGILAPGTERILRAAGISPGASVLDVGTGLGNVAIMAAELVGPLGSVLGIDREAGILERARSRAMPGGAGRVTFENTALEALEPRSFDVVLWRWVLHHQADRVTFLREAAGFVRPGGKLICIELDVRSRERSSPPVALFDKAIDCIITAYRLAGAHLGTGGELVWLFDEAGLPEPDLLREDPIGGPNSPILEWVCRSVRALLPALEEHEVTTAAELGIDTLQTRMRAAVSEAHSQVRLANVVGAWVQID